MGWLSSIYQAQRFESSLARELAPPKRPITPDEAALVIGLLAALGFLILSGVVLKLLGVESVVWPVVLLFVVGAILVCGFVVGVLTGATGNRTFEGDNTDG